LLISSSIVKFKFKSIAYVQIVNCQPWTPPKHEKEDDKSFVDLAMFDTEDDKSFSVDLKLFDTEDSNAFDPDDCCHHIEKVSTSIQMFTIFITSLMVIN
jgi:hypothetical protein